MVILDGSWFSFLLLYRQPLVAGVNNGFGGSADSRADDI